MRRGGLFLVVLAAALACAAEAQRRDPLTPDEVDTLRDTADDPVKRIKHLVKFVRVRLTDLDKARALPVTDPHRVRKVRQSLEDLDALLDSRENNVEMYHRQRADIRKALAEVVPAYRSWNEYIAAMKKAGLEEPTEHFDEYRSYLDTVSETLTDGSEFIDEVAILQAQAAADAKRKKK